MKQRILIPLLAAFTFLSLFYWPTILRGRYAYQDWRGGEAIESIIEDTLSPRAPLTEHELARPYDTHLSPELWVLRGLGVGPATATSLMLVLYGGLGLAGMYWLCRDLGAHADVSMLICALLGGWGGMAARWAVGHYLFLGLWFLSLILYSWHRRWLFLTAALVALGVYEGFHHLTVMTAIVLVLIAVSEAVTRWRWEPLRSIAFVGLLAAVLASVKLSAELSEHVTYRAWTGACPVPISWLWAMFTDPNSLPRVSWGLWEWTQYFSWPGTVILGFGLVCSVARLRTALPWLCASALLALWSLGYGAATLYQIPILSSQGILAQVLMVAIVVAMPAAAVGLSAVLSPLRCRMPVAVSLGVASLAAWCACDLWVYSLQWQFIVG
jgi:hypothetical protein